MSQDNSLGGGEIYASVEDCLFNDGQGRPVLVRRISDFRKITFRELIEMVADGQPDGYNLPYDEREARLAEYVRELMADAQKRPGCVVVSVVRCNSEPNRTIQVSLHDRVMAYGGMILQDLPEELGAYANPGTKMLELRLNEHFGAGG